MAKLPLVANLHKAELGNLREELTQKYVDYACAQISAIRSGKSRGRCTAPHATILYSICSHCFDFDGTFMLRLQLTQKEVEDMYHAEQVARARGYLTQIYRGDIGAAHSLWYSVHERGVRPEEFGMTEDLLLQNPYYRQH